MTPEQRHALPDALRYQLEGAKMRGLHPTVEVARVCEAADGHGHWLVLGCYCDDDTNEFTFRSSVAPNGAISPLTVTP